MQGLRSEFPSPRWICLKRLSKLHLYRFEIRVFLLLGRLPVKAYEFCLPGYLTHSWGKIVEVSGHIHTPVGLSTATLGVLLLRDPLQFSLTATRCQLPVVCREEALQQSCY